MEPAILPIAQALEWDAVKTTRPIDALRKAVGAGYVPLFEDLGGGKAQLVHLSYQELLVGEFMARALTSASPKVRAASAGELLLSACRGAYVVLFQTRICRSFAEHQS